MENSVITTAGGAEPSIIASVHEAEVLRPAAPPLAPVAAPSRGDERSAVLSRAMAAGDCLSAALGAAAAVVALGEGSPDRLWYVAFAAICWPAVAFALGLYGDDDLRTWISGVPEIPRGLVAALVATWPLFGAATLLGRSSAGVLALATLLLTVPTTSLVRAGVRARLHRVASLRQRTVILGSGVVAGKVVEKLRQNDQAGLEPIGLVDDHVHERGTPDLPRLGGLSDLSDVLRRHRIERVIIAFSRASHEELLSCVRACRNHGVAVDVIPRLFEFLDGLRALDYIGGLPVLSIGRPRLSRTAQVAKRTLDLVVAVGTIVLLAPLLLAIAAAVRLESPGPVFFSQPRAGRDRRVFRLLKFRSMYANAETRKSELTEINEASDGVMFKIRRDPRITKVGRLLRRFSLDELPQLFNVVRGDMSIVGPRPLILPETDALAENWHLRRLEMRPGLTGPWQIYGRSETPFQEMVRFDYQYVAGWSLARDFEILFATVPAVLSGRGAY